MRPRTIVRLKCQSTIAWNTVDPRDDDIGVEFRVRSDRQP
jgi:hypothetical protein